MPDPGDLQPQRVYRADAVARALGHSVQSVKDRIQRGASMRGWAQRDAANTAGLWLVDADHADAHYPEIAAAQLPSGRWPLPLLSPTPAVSAGTIPNPESVSNVASETGSGDEELYIARREAVVEHNRRLIGERDAAREKLEILQQAKDREIELLSKQLELAQEELKTVNESLRIQLQAHAAMIRPPTQP